MERSGSVVNSYSKTTSKGNEQRQYWLSRWIFLNHGKLQQMTKAKLDGKFQSVFYQNRVIYLP
ncbi:hypothetical protein A9Q74_17045 [Colwellia sp. 39_35_sub15_T18]|nr:hypothetical protein A9Q74_17045 [Colwellia sp. 39_35_sub15_T18]